MKRKKRIQKKAKYTKRQPSVSQLVLSHKSELLMGSSVVLIALFFVLGSTRPRAINAPKALAVPTAPVLRPTIASISAQITPTATPSAQNNYYVLQPNESLAKVGERMCGDKRAYLYIEEDNGLVEPYTLHPGDSVVVNCR